LVKFGYHFGAQDVIERPNSIYFGNAQIRILISECPEHVDNCFCATVLSKTEIVRCCGISELLAKLLGQCSSNKPLKGIGSIEASYLLSIFTDGREFAETESIRNFHREIPFSHALGNVTKVIEGAFII